MTISAFFVTIFLLIGVYWFAKALFFAAWHTIKFLWHHKMVAVMLIGIAVCSGVFHDPANSLTFHNGAPGVIGYFFTGAANFFYGFWQAILHLCGNLAMVPEKIGDIGGIENTGGYILAGMLYTTWAFAETAVFWGTNFLINADTCWGSVLLIGFLYVLSGGGSAIISAAMKGGGGGGHGAKPKAGGHH